MKKLKTSLIILLGLVVIAERGVHAAATPAKAKSTKSAKADKGKKSAPKKSSKNASALLTDMEKSTAFIMKSATAAKLSPKQKKEIPFFSGLKIVEENVDLMKKSSVAKDPAFFKQMEATGKAFVQINSSARMLRVKDKDTLDGIRALGTSYNELQTNYGKLAARKKKGGELSPKESEQLAKLRTDVNKLQADLAKLKAKIKAKNDPELLLRFDECSKNASKVSRAKGNSLATFILVSESVDLFYFEWSALGESCEYFYPDVYTEWTATNASFDVYFDYYEESYSSWEVSDWSYLETSYDVVDSLETYDVSVSETELSSIETSMESYSETSATEETTEVDLSSEVSESESYELEDDEDGDGLEDSVDDDDDGDGTSDDADTDDDGDGVDDGDAAESDDAGDDSSDDSGSDDGGGDDGGGDDGGGDDSGGGEE